MKGALSQDTARLMVFKLVMAASKTWRRLRGPAERLIVADVDTEPVRQGVHRCFGSIAPGVARGLKLRHDHGSNYMSGDFQDEIKCLGIEASPSFVREPEGNGVAERFIRTLKENLLWVRTFKTIEDLRAELLAFARRYNETWLVARHGYKTPARVREEQTTPRIAIDPTLAATLPLAA